MNIGELLKDSRVVGGVVLFLVGILLFLFPQLEPMETELLELGKVLWLGFVGYLVGNNALGTYERVQQQRVQAQKEVAQIQAQTTNAQTAQMMATVFIDTLQSKGMLKRPDADADRS